MDIMNFESTLNVFINKQSVKDMKVILHMGYNLTKKEIVYVSSDKYPALVNQAKKMKTLADLSSLIFEYREIIPDKTDLFSEEYLEKLCHNGNKIDKIDFFAKFKGALEPIWVQMYCNIVEEENQDIKVLLFFRDLTYEHIIGEAVRLASSYTKENVCIILPKEGILHQMFDPWDSFSKGSKSVVYDEMMEEYCEKYVLDFAKKKFLKDVSLEKVCRKLEKKSRYTVQFPVERKQGKICHIKYHFSYLNDHKRSILLYQTDITSLVKMQHDLEYDALTDIYNREKLIYETKKMLKKYPDHKFAFLIVDIKNFKLFNTIFGSEEGNKLLIEMAKIIKGIAKCHQNYVFGRIQADRFAICSEITEDWLESDLEKGIDKLRKYRTDYFVEIAIGIYQLETNEESIDNVIMKATMAVNQCKMEVNSSYVKYDKKKEEQCDKEQKITGKMHTALDEEQFEVYLQPKYSLQTKSACGAEALVRWFYPKHGMISPGEFIPVFEKNGFIAKLDQYMWEHVCMLLSKWKKSGYHVEPVSVNVSRISLYNSKLKDILCGLVEKYDIEPGLLHLEITESAYMANPELMKQTIHELHMAGFVLLMDDFGSGYSSLNTLKDFYVDVLKIDMGFLSKSTDSIRADIILESIVKMSKRLNISIIVEGVETKGEFQFLEKIGAEAIQGYYYSRPIPAAEYEKNYLLSQRKLEDGFDTDGPGGYVRKIDFHNMLSECQKIMITTGDIDRILEIVGCYYQADRACLFSLDFDRDILSNMNEYVAKGIKKQIETLQNIPLGSIECWLPKLKDGTSVYINDLEKLLEDSNRKEEYNYLKKQNVFCLIVVPVLIKGKLYGFLSVENPSINRTDEEFLESLTFFMAHEMYEHEVRKKLLMNAGKEIFRKKQKYYKNYKSKKYIQ